jgi:predicted Fe-Mo cluster-binding NifX family protein
MAGIGMRLAAPVVMKIAISHWHGRIAPVFDVADNLLLIDIEEGRRRGRENVSLSPYRDSFGRARDVSALGVHVLLCGAVSHTLETALIGSGIQVYGFLCGNMDDVLDAFLQNRLSDERFFMPGHHAESQPGGGHRQRPGRAKKFNSTE